MAWAAIPAIIGSIASIDQSNKGRAAANDAQKAALQEYARVQMPSVEEQKLVLEMLASQGQLTPEMLQALNLGPAAMEDVTANQDLVNKQDQALNEFSNIGKDGLTEADMAAAREMERRVSSSDMARRKAILNEMAQRGVLGSGMELAAKLQGAQDSTETQAAANDKLIQQANERKLAALQNLGNMSSSMRSQDFNEKSARAQAKDEIAKFNLANQQRVNDTNVANKNTAMASNLANKQRIADANVGLKNAQQTANKALLQQRYENQMQLANARSGRQQAIGTTAQAGYNAVGQGIAGIGSGLTNLFSGFGKNDNNGDINLDRNDYEWLNSKK